MTVNETFRRRIAAYGASSDEFLDELTREIWNVRAQIAEVKGQQSRPENRPESGADLGVLERRLAELHDRRYDATSATAGAD